MSTTTDKRMPTGTGWWWGRQKGAQYKRPWFVYEHRDKGHVWCGDLTCEPWRPVSEMEEWGNRCIGVDEDERIHIADQPPREDSGDPTGPGWWWVWCVGNAGDDYEWKPVRVSAHPDRGLQFWEPSLHGFSRVRSYKWGGPCVRGGISQAEADELRCERDEAVASMDTSAQSLRGRAERAELQAYRLVARLRAVLDEAMRG